MAYLTLFRSIYVFFVCLVFFTPFQEMVYFRYITVVIYPVFLGDITNTHSLQLAANIST